MKDLSDQLRTVHLTLVLVAFVLLAASLQEPPRKIEHAVADARSIFLLATTLDSSAGPVGDEVTRDVNTYADHYSGQELQVSNLKMEISWPSNEKQTVAMSIGSAYYIADARYEASDSENPAYDWVQFRVRSLGDFIRFWDHNATDQTFIVPKVKPENVVRLSAHRSSQWSRYDCAASKLSKRCPLSGVF